MTDQEKYSKWKKYLSGYFSGRLKISPYNLYFDKLFRARIVKQKSVDDAFVYYNHPEKIWNPNRKNTSLQRCNIAGQSTLYLSSGIRSLPFELSAKIGDLICVGRFDSIQPKLEMGPYGVLGIKYLMEFDDINSIFRNYYKDFSEENKALEQKLSNIFSAKCKTNGFKLYCVTSAISSIYLNKPKKVFKKRFKLNEKFGLVYPCVERNFYSFNIAIKPSFAKKVYTVRNLEILEYLGSNKDGASEFNLKATGRVKNNLIQWTKRTESKSRIYIK